MDGVQLLKHIKNINQETAFIIMTGYGTVETAVKAIKLGAYDFLLKPVTPETIEHIMQRVTEMLDLKQENATMRQELSDKFQNIIGKSKEMRQWLLKDYNLHTVISLPANASPFIGNVKTIR